MKVLVTGAAGMLGQAAVAEFGRRGHEVVPLAKRDLDVADEPAVRRVVEAVAPDAVVQCAAYTAVDAAEREIAEAVRINVTGAGLVAKECQRIGAMFVYPSTDYVFSGESRTPWTPGARKAPINQYGRSKAAGEDAVQAAGPCLVVRTSWLYGAGGRNFVDTISEVARAGGELKVVDDQVGRPTWTRSLAQTIAELVERRQTGTFHASDGGTPVSWCEFAREIVERQGLPARISPVSSEANPKPARRPLYSVLDCSDTEAVVGYRMPDWKAMLGRYLAEKTASDGAAMGTVAGG